MIHRRFRKESPLIFRPHRAVHNDVTQPDSRMADTFSVSSSRACASILRMLASALVCAGALWLMLALPSHRPAHALHAGIDELPQGHVGSRAATHDNPGAAGLTAGLVRRPNRLS